MIALHGWLDNAATYDYLAPRIAREFEADVACLDFPGHGASDHRAHSFGVGYSFLDYSASVLSFINALGWGGEEVHLVRDFPARFPPFWLLGAPSAGASAHMSTQCPVFFKSNRAGSVRRRPFEFPTVVIGPSS